MMIITPTRISNRLLLGSLLLWNLVGVDAQANDEAESFQFLQGSVSRGLAAGRVRPAQPIQPVRPIQDSQSTVRPIQDSQSTEYVTPSQCWADTFAVTDSAIFQNANALTSVTPCEIDFTTEDSCIVNAAPDLSRINRGCLDAGGRLFNFDALDYNCQYDWCEDNKCKTKQAKFTFLNYAYCFGTSCTAQDIIYTIKTYYHPEYAKSWELGSGFDKCTITYQISAAMSQTSAAKSQTSAATTRKTWRVNVSGAAMITSLLAWVTTAW